MVNDAEKFIMNLKEPVIVIGHSLGGTLAIELIFRKVYIIYTFTKGIHNVDRYPLKTYCIALEKFITELREPVVLIGHSFGGILAYEIAFKKPNLIKNLIVIDLSPTRYPMDVEKEAIMLVNIMRKSLNMLSPDISLPEAERKINELFQKYITVIPLCKLLLRNLMKTVDGFQWKCNIEDIEHFSKEQYFRKAYPLTGFYQDKALLIHAEQSDYVRLQDYDDIQKQIPKIKLYCVKDCLHWIHMEKREELIDQIVTFLNKK